MVLGEAGIIPAFLFLIFLARLLSLGVNKAEYGGLITGFCMVFLGNMLTAHDVLTLRFQNVVLGIVIALSLTGARNTRSSD